VFSHSYFTLTVLRQFVDGRNEPKSNLAPRSIGSSASPLMSKLDGGHYGVKAASRELDMVRYWIESGASYPGTYAALGSGMIGGSYENCLDISDRQWPSSVAAAEVVQRRCTPCHNKSTPRLMPIPRALSEGPLRNIVFNLTRPDKSLVLLAPLSKQAGGYGLCKTAARNGQSAERAGVFADTHDSDYQTIFALCMAGKKHLDRIKRFDMPDFRPIPTYVREMKRYGIIPENLAADAGIDAYATDRAYWRSLWYRPDAGINQNK
jgi:hypothetical protein